MSKDLDLYVQYNNDKITIIENHEGSKYRVARWTEEQARALDDEVREIVENAEEMVENEPEEVIERLYGDKYAWEEQRAFRKI